MYNINEIVSKQKAKSTKPTIIHDHSSPGTEKMFRYCWPKLDLMAETGRNQKFW